MKTKESKKTSEKISLETVAYKEIRNAIISGVFPPSYQVVEEQISTQLNMSRSPVRGAIKRLQTEGFLEKRDNKRIYVAIPDKDKIIDILYLREALDGMTARLAAINRTEEDVKRINNIIKESQEALKSNDLYKQHELAMAIHHEIYDACKSELLCHYAKNAENQVTLFTFHSFQESSTRSVAAFEEHITICRHVIEQNPDAAEKAARSHIRKLIDRVMIVEKNRQQDQPSKESFSHLRP